MKAILTIFIINLIPFNICGMGCCGLFGAESLKEEIITRADFTDEEWEALPPCHQKMYLENSGESGNNLEIKNTNLCDCDFMVAQADFILNEGDWVTTSSLKMFLGQTFSLEQSPYNSFIGISSLKTGPPDDYFIFNSHQVKNSISFLI